MLATTVKNFGILSFLTFYAVSCVQNQIFGPILREFSTKMRFSCRTNPHKAIFVKKREILRLGKIFSLVIVLCKFLAFLH